jgi:hypothetical protein
MCFVNILPTAAAGEAVPPWSSSFQLLATGGADGDRFGSSVAISNATALVGAPQHDFQGNNSGAAYLFDATLGSQVHKLVATDQAPFDQYVDDKFGFAVALGSGRTLITAPNDGEFGSGAGAVYAFDASTGLQTQKFVASDIVGGEQLGYSVAISGNTAVVGALTAQGFAGASGVGAAYVFTHNGSNWSYDYKLAIDDPDSTQDGDMFGWSVDLDGTTAIVGGRDEFGNAGTAYLFDTSTGTQLAKLSAAANGVTGLGDT